MDLYKRRRIDAHVDMTPMIDTLLQLFMIFLFGATFVSASVNLDLPKEVTEKSSTKASVKELIVSIDAKNKIYLNSHPIEKENLKTTLQSMLPQSKDQMVLLLADRSLLYERVLEVMIEIQGTGAAKVVLAYDPIKNK